MKSYVYDKKLIPDHYRAHRIDSLNIDKEEDGVEKKDFIWKMGGQQGQGLNPAEKFWGVFWHRRDIPFSASVCLHPGSKADIRRLPCVSRPRKLRRSGSMWIVL